MRKNEGKRTKRITEDKGTQEEGQAVDPADSTHAVREAGRTKDCTGNREPAWLSRMKELGVENLNGGKMNDF